MTGLRVGHGYDVHRLAQGRPLILGGVTIPWEKGLDGHSDADVLTHAVMDALLGAAGMDDIGRLFPDCDNAFLNISSLTLLERVMKALTEQGWQVVNWWRRPQRSPPTGRRCAVRWPGRWASGRSR